MGNKRSGDDSGRQTKVGKEVNFKVFKTRGEAYDWVMENTPADVLEKDIRDDERFKEIEDLFSQGKGTPELEKEFNNLRASIVSEYVGHNYEAINYILRNYEEAKNEYMNGTGDTYPPVSPERWERINNNIERLISIINENTIQEPVTVFRVFGDRLKEYKKGDVYDDKGFLSTTMIKSDLNELDEYLKGDNTYHGKIRISEGFNALPIDRTMNAVDFSKRNYDVGYTQHELLMPPKGEYTIDEIDHVNRTYVMTRIK